MPGEIKNYVVQSGETISSIAKANNVTVKQVAEWNKQFKAGSEGGGYSAKTSKSEARMAKGRDLDYLRAGETIKIGSNEPSGKNAAAVQVSTRVPSGQTPSNTAKAPAAHVNVSPYSNANAPKPAPSDATNSKSEANRAPEGAATSVQTVVAETSPSRAPAAELKPLPTLPTANSQKIIPQNTNEWGQAIPAKQPEKAANPAPDVAVKAQAPTPPTPPAPPAPAKIPTKEFNHLSVINVTGGPPIAGGADNTIGFLQEDASNKYKDDQKYSVGVKYTDPGRVQTQPSISAEGKLKLFSVGSKPITLLGADNKAISVPANIPLRDDKGVLVKNPDGTQKMEENADGTQKMKDKTVESFGGKWLGRMPAADEMASVSVTAKLNKPVGTIQQEDAKAVNDFPQTSRAHIGLAASVGPLAAYHEWGVGDGKIRNVADKKISTVSTNNFGATLAVPISSEKPVRLDRVYVGINGTKTTTTSDTGVSAKPVYSNAIFGETYMSFPAGKGKSLLPGKDESTTFDRRGAFRVRMDTPIGVKFNPKVTLRADVPVFEVKNLKVDDHGNSIVKDQMRVSVYAQAVFGKSNDPRVIGPNSNLDGRFTGTGYTIGLKLNY